MKLFRPLVLAVALGAGTLSASNSLEVNNNNHYFQLCRDAVTQAQVTDYLISTGHSLETNPISSDGGITWTAYTHKRGDSHLYFTTVVTNGECIVGFEDVMVE
jgi:hypothetical protein